MFTDHIAALFHARSLETWIEDDKTQFLKELLHSVRIVAHYMMVISNSHIPLIISNETQNKLRAHIENNVQEPRNQRPSEIRKYKQRSGIINIPSTVARTLHPLPKSAIRAACNTSPAGVRARARAVNYIRETAHARPRRVAVEHRLCPAMDKNLSRMRVYTRALCRDEKETEGDFAFAGGFNLLSPGARSNEKPVLCGETLRLPALYVSARPSVIAESLIERRL